MIRVAIVDGHASIRWGLREFLSGQADIEVFAGAELGREAQELAKAPDLDVMLLDIRLPDLNGVDVLKFIQRRALRVKVLVISSFSEESYALIALRMGASGYLRKDCTQSELVRAVRTIHAGRKYITPVFAELMAQAFVGQDEPKHGQLSQRQMQVFLRMAAGAKPQAIAKALSLSPQSVSALAHEVRQTLELQTPGQLTAYAFKQGLIQ